jgi:hypothetical protein
MHRVRKPVASRARPNRASHERNPNAPARWRNLNVIAHGPSLNVIAHGPSLNVIAHGPNLNAIAHGRAQGDRRGRTSRDEKPPLKGSVLGATELRRWRRP